jgi:hypothetical protein
MFKKITTTTITADTVAFQGYISIKRLCSFNLYLIHRLAYCLHRLSSSCHRLDRSNRLMYWLSSCPTQYHQYEARVWPSAEEKQINKQ